MQPQVTITIDTAGQATVEVHGTCGASCADLTRDLERALGTVTEDHKKPEYFQQQRAGQPQQQQMGAG